ncbi:MAG: YbhN family protein [Actinomycetota bacterium]|nr:YbhN family protein [Actinomycetota bacterium]
MGALNPSVVVENAPPQVRDLPEATVPGGDGRPEPPKKKRRRFGLPRPVYTLGRLLILALLVEYLVVPQLAGEHHAIHLLTRVDPLLLLAGLGLEVGALVAYGRLTKAVLPQSSRIRFFTIFRIELTTLSVSHCAPGGSATGTALGYRLLTQFGAAPSDAGFALGVQGIGSAIVLNVILWVALVVSIPVWGFSPEYLLAALVGGILLGLAALLVLALTRGGDRVGARLERAASHVPFVDGDVLRRSYGQLSVHLAQLTSRKEVMVRATVWATLNWLLDAASLFVFVGAFGKWVNPDGLLVAYGLANVLAALPITPGGLGVVEAALTTLLVGFGAPSGSALFGVVVYRLVQFWAPIPVGGLAYLSLQASRHQESRAQRLDTDDDTGDKVPMLSILRHFRRDQRAPAESNGLTSTPK